VRRASVGKLLLGELPDPFVWVELGRVARESDEVEATNAQTELRDKASAVRAATVPEQEDMAA
jgi:hypothetical protein